MATLVRGDPSLEASANQRGLGTGSFSAAHFLIPRIEIIQNEQYSRRSRKRRLAVKD